MARYLVTTPLPVGGWGVYDIATRTMVAHDLTKEQAETECERLMEAARQRYERTRRESAVQ